MNKGRSKSYKRDNKLMDVLAKVNDFAAQFPLDTDETKLKHRPVFIMGCARSGSTVFLQSLVNTGVFAYPSNLISRFYTNPSFGALIQKMLIDYDPKKQIFDPQVLAESKQYNSDLGHTKGALAPSEFWYFWRQYFKFGDIQKLSPEELEKVNIDSFLNHLVALEGQYDKPLLMKGMIMNWNIPFLYQHIPNALFVYVKRDPFFVAQSILESRRKFFGTMDKWWSFKPVEYPQLKDLSPVEQVAGQVYYTNQASIDGIAAIPEENKICIDYEDFCTNPKQSFDKITTKIFPNGIQLKSELPTSFQNSNRVRLEPKFAADLEKAIHKFYK